MDYFCARLSDIVVNISSNVSQERKLFWKKQVAQKEIIHFIGVGGIEVGGINLISKIKILAHLIQVGICQLYLVLYAIQVILEMRVKFFVLVKH